MENRKYLLFQLLPRDFEEMVEIINEEEGSNNDSDNDESNESEVVDYPKQGAMSYPATLHHY